MPDTPYRILEADRSHYLGAYNAHIWDELKRRAPYVVESVFNPPARELTSAAETAEEPRLVDR